VPVAVITNGSLMDLPAVREELCAADLVVPSLDAGSEALYRRINRAARVWSLERLVRGLSAFRTEFAGRIWVEVMLIRGVNDGEESLRDLAGVLQRIGPDEVHLNLPVRPPAESWVEPPDDAGLARAGEVLGKVARVVSPKTPLLNLAGSKDVVETIVQLVARHPLAEEEIVQAIEQWQVGEPAELLKRLEASGRARRLERGGKGFWTGAEGRYVEKSPSRCHTPPGR
jgi:wyosine [tRNA(Phe)-imidazoG37] synthetase (radical SAM superfamily)